jgi:hypothetical protein
MSKSEGGAIPLDLRSSLIVIIIPGGVALTTVGLVLTVLCPSVLQFYEAHQATSNVVVFIMSVRQYQRGTPQLGHASAQVTLDVYVQLIPGRNSAAADAFEVMAGGSREPTSARRSP